jgi:hypothetical protein
MRAQVYSAQLPTRRRDEVSRGFFVARPGRDGEADWVLSEQTDSLEVAHAIAGLHPSHRALRFIRGGVPAGRAFTVAELSDELLVIESVDTVATAAAHCHVHEVALAA